MDILEYFLLWFVGRGLVLANHFYKPTFSHHEKNPPPRLACILAIALLLTVTTARSQTETDTSFRFQMNTIFGPLDKSKVPYGILRDYAMEFINLEYYNGTATLVDSNYVHANSFWPIYKTLSSGRLNTGSNYLPRVNTFDSVWYASLKTDTLVLAGLHALYSRFKDNAYPSFITITSNKLYDKYVSGVWQNPYQTERVFAISTPVNTSDSLAFKILLPTNLWVSNTSYTAMSINMGDGLGYRTLTPGTPLAVSYNTPGLKEWIYRIQISGGPFLYAHSLVAVGSPPAGTQ